MAKKIMARTRLEKVNITGCVFCNFDNELRNAYENKKRELEEKYPDKSFYSWWDIHEKIEKENPFPGYLVTTMRTAREDDYDWNADRNGLYRTGTVEVCENCMGTINKCFSNLGEAEENGYSRKEFKTFVLPTEVEMEVKEEE